jgi:hypothetical protein
MKVTLILYAECIAFMIPIWPRNVFHASHTSKLWLVWVYNGLTLRDINDVSVVYNFSIRPSSKDDGDSDGGLVGICEGSAVGVDVGTAEGRRVMPSGPPIESVGTGEGMPEGRDEGTVDGTFEGTLDGILDG